MPDLYRIRRGIIGEGRAITTPYGQRRLTYLDYAASGRAYGPLEGYIRDQVLPLYANVHTETTATGAQTSAFREEARNIIKNACNCGHDDALVFCGNGVTGAIHTLLSCMGLTVPCTGSYAGPVGSRPLALIGAYEHHSVEIALRECAVELQVVRECGGGGVDLDHMRELCAQHRARSTSPIIGCFSAASNVTGRITDVDAVASAMHECGGIAFFDYAAAGPYVEIDMNAQGRAWKDAVFISPHKFIGGPGSPGVLLAKRNLFQNRVPAVPGGGTVASVTPSRHAYLSDVEHREEGGTPNVVGAIRAGLAFQLKQSVGASDILEHEHDFVKRFIEALRVEPELFILGDLDEPRLGIVSFVVQCTSSAQAGEEQATKALHHNFVVALLNDLFGIQTRGGNSCAAPYAHRLLRVSAADEDRIDSLVADGWHGCKPGWTRISFGWCDSEDTLAYAIACVLFVAKHGWRFLSDYEFNAATGTWRHRLGAVSYLRLGEAVPVATLPESVRVSYLREAQAIASAPRERVLFEPTQFEESRWFWLPGEMQDRS